MSFMKQRDLVVSIYEKFYNSNLQLKNNQGNKLMKLQYYSQYGEDKLLNRLFEKNDGTCIEIGANDGVKYSTSYFFEKKGWNCILVEPTPYLCSEIRKLRNATLFECAASTQNGETDFYIAEGFELFSSLESNSTMSEHLEKNNADVKKLKVKTRTLDSILEEADVGDIDFISIDVEGHEISVLKGFTLDKWLPKVVLLEDSTDLQETEVSVFMREHNYKRFYRSGGNDWYASPSEKRFRSFFPMFFSSQWSKKGLFKAWLPVFIKRTILRNVKFVKSIIK